MSESEEKVWVSIRISKELRDHLKARGHKTETYDDVIRRSLKRSRRKLKEKGHKTELFATKSAKTE